ncbi:MAG TPA: endonuclease MutS2 [Nitrolancea sp.]|nr:endonuclease MutS2 [Nitrolancea sp.]
MKGLELSVDTARVLEFPRVLEMLSRRCQYSVAVDRAREIGPSGDFDQVRYLQAVTREAVALLNGNPGFTVGGVRDIREIVERARVGMLLAPGDLRETLDTIQSSAALRRTFFQTGAAERFVLLAEFVESIAQLPALEADLSRTIGSRGEILDSASTALNDIRREVRVAHRRLLDRLNRMVADTGPNSAIQEPIVTMREGRYVIPVRADRRSQISGVVHATSASGQTLFMEPMDVVEMNNRWRELQMAEQHEIERILRALSDQVGSYANELIQNVEAVAAIDLSLAKARLSFDLNAKEPNIFGGPDDSANPPAQAVNLRQARHPLLDPTSVVPIDIRLGDGQRVLVVTGPNTGGKTIALKTVGLLAMMAQSGLFIPAADGSGLSVFDGIFADIGDEQSIEQSLSTFSGHMTKIIAMLKAADARSLVLIDEIAAGTDPQEGSALARAIITAFLERGSLAIVTTHYSELKSFAYVTSGVENASAEFDMATLRPTYRLITGVPGRSNAVAIAQRLGLPRSIAEAARSYLEPEAEQADELLSQIQHRRGEADELLRRAEAEVARANQIKDSAQESLREADLIRANARQEAIDDVAIELREARELIRQARRPAVVPQIADADARSATPPSPAELKRVETQIQQAARRQRPTFARPEPIRVGDWVSASNLGIEGEVVGFADGGETVELLSGSFRLTQPIGAVRRAPRSEPEGRKRRVSPLPSAPAVDSEIHLRGMRVHEIEEELDRYLDLAARANLPWVRIVHGKGTGALRSQVQDVLKRNPLVDHSELAEAKAGGDGVTIAFLKD